MDFNCITPGNGQTSVSRGLLCAESVIFKDIKVKTQITCSREASMLRPGGESRPTRHLSQLRRVACQGARLQTLQGRWLWKSRSPQPPLGDGSPAMGPVNHPCPSAGQASGQGSGGRGPEGTAPPWSRREQPYQQAGQCQRVSFRERPMRRLLL